MLEKIMKKFKISQNKMNVMRLSGGTLIGQLISVVTIPFATRMFGAKVIGDWGVLQATATMANAISSLGLLNAVVVKDTDQESEDVVTAVSTFGMAFGILTGLFYIFAHSSMKVIRVNTNPIFAAIFLFVAVFTLQQVQLCYNYLNKNKEYKILMWNPMLTNGLFGILSVIFGLLGFKQYGYHVAWIIGQIVALIHMRRFMPSFKVNFSPKFLKSVIKDNDEFVKYQFPALAVATVKNQIPTYLIKGLFGADMVGYYTMTVKILKLPITFLASAIGRVFFQTLAELKDNKEKLKNYAYRNINKLLKYSAIPMFFLLICGDVIVTIFLGKSWEVAGVMIRILALENMFLFLYQMSYGLPIVINKQKLSLYINIAQFAIYCISFVLGKVLFNDIYAALYILTIGFIISNVIYFAYMFSCMGISAWHYVRKVTTVFVVMVALAEVCRFVLKLIGIVSTM